MKIARSQLLIKLAFSVRFKNCCCAPTWTLEQSKNGCGSIQRRVTTLTLTHQALAMCSPERLPSELDKIKSILLTNGYPERVFKLFMAMKMKQFHALPKFGPEKCPVYLRIPWLGSVSTRFEKQVKSAVKQCFSAVEPRVVYSTNYASPCYQQGCTACFTEKQRDLPILMPL